MSLVEYKNSNGKTEKRDRSIGKIESDLRRKYLEDILPALICTLKDEFGDIFHIEIVGSTAKNMARPESDIDLLVTISKHASPHVTNQLAVIAYHKIYELCHNPASYKVDLWVEHLTDQETFKTIR